ncbi:molybdopterin-synthase adenylyltransferase MoeB [Oryzibacter oryziterrae]|uniref:molybdopterin-synthase adenylyltransferase MoeB n=1 Tax=Oryzibacter oryziterrae TaxID=2766474 RepID=UPI001F219FF7|nr:molybdopterin-synthase adenylyltransferase MoeB [Oryzibacter oryziterrae]
MTTLSEAEIARFARHIVLREVGGPGQQKLKAARVLVIGAGGLGAPVIQYLAAAGVGTLGLVDDDIVSLSNLQRQVIHATENIGKPKVASATEAVGHINPHVEIEAHQVRFTQDNAADLVAAYDIAVDGSDNFKTRYLLADTCETVGRPLVTAAIGAFDGSLTTLTPHLKDEAGNPLPGYRDLFPEPPPQGLVPSCAETGVIGALPGILGSMQAMEVIKLICGIGEPLIGRLLLVDSLSMRFETIRYRRGKR